MDGASRRDPRPSPPPKPRAIAAAFAAPPLDATLRRPARCSRTDADGGRRFRSRPPRFGFVRRHGRRERRRVGATNALTRALRRAGWTSASRSAPRGTRRVDQRGDRLAERQRVDIGDRPARITKLASNVAELGRLGLVAADVVAPFRDADVVVRAVLRRDPLATNSRARSRTPRETRNLRPSPCLTRTSLERRCWRFRGRFRASLSRWIGRRSRSRVGLASGTTRRDQRRQTTGRRTRCMSSVRPRCRCSNRVGVVARDARWRPRPRRPSRSPSSRRSRRCP